MKKYHLLAPHFIHDAYYPKNTVIDLPDDFQPTATMEQIHPIGPAGKAWVEPPKVIKPEVAHSVAHGPIDKGQVVIEGKPSPAKFAWRK